MDGEALHIARNKWLQYNKLLLSPDETFEAIGVKRATLFKLLAAGEIPSIQVRRRSDDGIYARPQE